VTQDAFNSTESAGTPGASTRPDSTQAAVSAGDLRITVLATLAWRAMTEIVRRRHVTHGFDLLQVHPGISIAGLIELHLRPRDGDQPLRITFNLGGPYPGTWE